MRQLWENPIFLRSRQVEERTSGGGARALFLRYGVSIAILFGPLGLYFMFSLDRLLSPGEWNTVELAPMVGFSCFMMVLYCTFKALGSTFSTVSLEKEQRTYDPLMGTLLTPVEVVAGKLGGALWPVARELLAFVPPALALGWVAGCLREVSLLLLLCATSASFFGTLGLLTSFGATSTRVASRVGTAVAAFLIVGGPILDWFLWALAGADLGLSQVCIGTLASPVAAASAVLCGQWSWFGTVAFYSVGSIFLGWACVRSAQVAEDR